MVSQHAYSSVGRSAAAFLLGAGFAVLLVGGITGASLSLLHYAGTRAVDRLGMASPAATITEPGLPG